MYSVAELRSVMAGSGFKADIAWARQILCAGRLSRALPSANGEAPRLVRFTECVLASCPVWSAEERTELCRVAAEVSEALSHLSEDLSRKRRLLLRAALLYDLASLPAMAASVLTDTYSLGMVGHALRRAEPFATLGVEWSGEDGLDTRMSGEVTPLFEALSSDAMSLARYQQGVSQHASQSVANELSQLAKDLMLDLTASELQAFAALLADRSNRSTRSNLPTGMVSMLSETRFPAELWRGQIEAIRGGLLDAAYGSWGLASPTGTGKTYLARLAILSTLEDDDEGTVLYLAPSKALVYEIGASLSEAMEPIGHSVIAVSPQIVDLGEDEQQGLQECQIAVLTPEKADLLLRLGHAFLERCHLVIVDEAHLLESSTRGVLLEFYLWRLRRTLPSRPRVVFLSAVAPNLDSLTGWMSTDHRSVTITERATRMRTGVYGLRGESGGVCGLLEYSDGTRIPLVGAADLERTKEKQLLQLASELASAGPVLVVAKGKMTCQTLAQKMEAWLRQRQRLPRAVAGKGVSDVVSRLISRAERELYSDVPLRGLVTKRIAYHHAGMPPRVRTAVEDAIRANEIDYVFATTTLAEGVNFPFSSVVVQSLAIREPPVRGQPARYQPVTPRSFWNIAGRAGRPGHDREGQAILFEPSLGLERIRQTLGVYLDSRMVDLPPLSSALGDGVLSILAALDESDIDLDMLRQVCLPENMPRWQRGTINHIRLSLIHAIASDIDVAPGDLLQELFAGRMMRPADAKRASALLQSQYDVVTDYLDGNRELSPQLVAEIGLSLETLTELKGYAQSLDDWQLQSMDSLLIGGYVRLDQAKYVLGPVAKRMAEMEGSKLGGLAGRVAEYWISGLPLSTVRSEAKYRRKLEELVKLIYSRIQYLLPWGLYAFHRLVTVQLECRGLPSGLDGVLNLAYLADAGVPSFDALRLLGLGFERVDATRLAAAYRRSPAWRSTDAVKWLQTRPLAELRQVVRGRDARPIDFDFDLLVQEIANRPATAR